MTALIAGLLLFLGLHSVRIFAPQWRSRQIAARGEKAWKGLYSLVSLAGLVLIVWGYGQTRAAPMWLWVPPLGMRHAAALLTLLSFILIAAAYVPRNALKARLHHPMVLGVKVWAFAHLLANGTVADVLLFGSFLAWAIVLYAVSRRRDRAAGVTYPPGTAGGTLRAVAAGAAAWAVFAFWAHEWLIGIAPLG
ncbi:NnrU family protein [Aquincola sp. MAHUQ-54]|uniref:NnrU family protein n=1 Tax=Aquincola agrisoli TaxID=3119538 RepID=A0AAW9QCV6_9BURK